MEKIIIWHNKNCTTSSKVVEFFQQQAEVIIRNYLEDTPSVEEIAIVLEKMAVPATAILRRNDKVFQEKFKTIGLSNEAWIEAMHENPSIIQRPIVIIGDKAYLGRPAADFIEKMIQLNSLNA